ncbi:MAG: type III-B CRISPR module-associated protein Cmr3 [Aggregatilineales bacterium]
MTMQWVFIEPLDVWMFRDSKPFTAQENFYARSLFPPQPGTMQGVIRSHHYALTGQIIGSSTDMGGLRLTGPFVAQRDQSGKTKLYVRAPLDLLAKAGEHGESVTGRRLLPAKQMRFKTDLDDQWRPLIPAEREKSAAAEKADEAEYWMDEAALATYLSDPRAPVELVKASQLYDREERVGLALDVERRANQSGHFYRASFIRPCSDVGLLVGIDYGQPIFLGSGALNIGGESRSGLYQVLDGYEFPQPRVSSGRLKIVLLTPAYFSDGWQPASRDWSPWVGSKAKLISAAVGKPQAFSGWDLQRNQPKPLRHFVPAGSVYLFEDAAAPSIPFTETPAGEADFGAMGFGAVLVGAWDDAD